MSKGMVILGAPKTLTPNQFATGCRRQCNLHVERSTYCIESVFLIVDFLGILIRKGTTRPAHLARKRDERTSIPCILLIQCHGIRCRSCAGGTFLSAKVE
jgi:hypothetical protein